MNRFPIMNERLYLRSPSINVCFRAVIEGTLDKNKIENALKTVCIKHPLINCSLEGDNDNHWLTLKNEPVGIEYFTSPETDWKRWYKKIDNIPFDFSKGPLVKFCIITGMNTEIIILGHHIIGDGIGYLNLLKDVLLALDNKIDGKPQIPPFEPADRYFRQTVLLDQPTKDYARWLNSEWRKNRRHFSEKEYYDFFEQYRKKYIPNIYTASLEGDVLNKLFEKSKSNGLTVNEIIASAFSAATMETLEKSEFRIGVAANIRTELVSCPNNCMGNYVTGISIKANRDPEYDFILYTKKIATLLREQLSNLKNRHLVVHFLNEFDKDLIESVIYAAYSGFDHPAAKKLAELIGEQSENKGLGISNLGRHYFNNYENIKVTDIQFIGPAFPANLLTVGIITNDNRLNLCLRYNEGETTTDIIETIYEKAIELLK